jgi:hypothetical protein
MKRLAAFLVVLSTIAASPAAARPVGEAASLAPLLHRDRICAHIEASAGDYGLPVPYLTRLIWRESSFRPDVVSPKGAQGIAQFMPTTAAERGLADPFEPASAIDAAASFLTDLRSTFGNLGLAAAAYNGGPNRIAGWLDGNGGLPFETEYFVRFVTGRTAFDWKTPADEETPEAEREARSPDGLPEEIVKPGTCAAVVATLAKPVRIAAGIGPSPTAPWGAQVAGHFSKDRALRIYANLQGRYEDILAGKQPMVVGTRNRSRGSAVFFAVRVPAATREDADAVCTRLKKAGAACIVQKS